MNFSVKQILMVCAMCGLFSVQSGSVSAGEDSKPGYVRLSDFSTTSSDVDVRGQSPDGCGCTDGCGLGCADDSCCGDGCTDGACGDGCCADGSCGANGCCDGNCNGNCNCNGNGCYDSNGRYVRRWNRNSKKNSRFYVPVCYHGGIYGSSCPCPSCKSRYNGCRPGCDSLGMAACQFRTRNAIASHNLCRWLECKFGYFIPTGGNGKGLPPVGHYNMVYSVNPGHADGRDGNVYAAEGYGVPMAVPLAPNVRHTYNYGWGIPSSRLTPVSHPSPVYGY